MTPPIYLDYNATTPVDPEVVEAMLPFFSHHFGNPASATHTHGWFAAESVVIAREQVAELLSAQPEEVVFTSGATESNNLALKGSAALRKAGHIISVATEHKSVLDPLAVLANCGFTVTLLGVDSSGAVSPAELEQALRPDTFLVSVMLGNNEIGTLQDITALSAVTRGRGVIFHCDATQALGRHRTAVGALGVDLLSCTAHKLYGPKGIGALWISNKLPAGTLSALLDGGGHEFGFRSGTLNVPGIVGFGRACTLAKSYFAAEPQRLHEFAQVLFLRLCSDAGNVHLNGPALDSAAGRLAGNLNLRFSGVDNAKLLGAVQTKLSISVSSACQSQQKTPSHVLAAIGLSPAEQREAVRIGIGRFTTEEEVAAAGAILSEAVRRLRPQ